MLPSEREHVIAVYHFHLTCDREYSDDEGVKLATLHDARCYAVRMIAEVLCTSPEAFWRSEDYRVTVCDSAGLTLFSVEMVSTDAPALR